MAIPPVQSSSLPDERIKASRAPGQVLLVAEGISKRYGMTQALTDAGLEVRTLEVHALLGENGAGKTTFVQILRGNVQPDAGEIRLDGQQVTIASPADATRLGIAAVYQELSLLPNLTVAQNLSIETIPTQGNRLASLLGVLDKREMGRRAVEVAERLGESWQPGDLVATLSVSQKQRLEISRAVSQNSRLLILDEPTSSLAPDDRGRLFRQLRALRDAGLAIIFITHNIEEALEVSDRVTVMRDGRHVGTLGSDEATVSEIVELMTGRAAGRLFPGHATSPGKRIPRLSVRGLRAEPYIKSVSFDVYPGEIVGVAGLVGSGRSKLLRCIYGMLERTDGEVLLDGEPLDARKPSEAIRAGIGLIPEDRQAEGMFPAQSVYHNIVVLTAVTSRAGWRGFVLSTSSLRRLASDLIRTVDIKASSVDLRANQLSGGNQQKLVIARLLAVHPRLILADEPTRGVSIGSKSEIYRTLRALTDASVSIAIVSSEFDELIGLCDRIVLVRDGVSVGETSPEGMTEDDLLNLLLASPDDRATGVRPQ